MQYPCLPTSSRILLKHNLPRDKLAECSLGLLDNRPRFADVDAN